jgi:hypothetical protein
MTDALKDEAWACHGRLYGDRAARIRELLDVTPRRLKSRLVGSTRADFDGAGTWSPAEDGARVITVPIYPHRLGWPYNIFAAPLDLLAFRLDDPATWALRRGDATALGYAEALEDPDDLDAGFALHLVGDPLTWIRADDRHFMALDWPSLGELWEGRPARVVCDQAATAEAVIAARGAYLKTRMLARPRVMVPRAAP